MNICPHDKPIDDANAFIERARFSGDVTGYDYFRIEWRRRAAEFKGAYMPSILTAVVTYFHEEEVPLYDRWHHSNVYMPCRRERANG